MSLKNAQYDAIMREYSRRQLINRHTQEEHRKEVYALCERFALIDQEVAAKSAAKAREMLNGKASGYSELQSEIQMLSAERQNLLKTFGFPADYLELPYHCEKCQDTGYAEGKKCTCFRQAELKLLYHQSHLDEILQKENFSHFSLDCYSDTIINETTGLSARSMAEIALKKALIFCDTVPEKPANLLLYGDTGVGKTFLSHCIAEDLLKKGVHVVYFSAYDLFEILAQHAFHHQEESQADHMIYDCDLLIIDDLGTELTNSFVASELFLCINERSLRGKSTIISTNLTLESLSTLYSERTFSRIINSYDIIKLIGQDIRTRHLYTGGK